MKIVSEHIDRLNEDQPFDDLQECCHKGVENYCVIILMWSNIDPSQGWTGGPNSIKLWLIEEFYIYIYIYIYITIDIV